MYEVIIEYPNGGKEQREFIPIYALMAALDKCEIESFTIRKRKP